MYRLLLIILVLLLSCTRNKVDDTKNNIKINNYIKAAQKGQKDSTIYFLKKIAPLLSINTPDSLKAENNFLKSRYYNLINKDSSLYYHLKAISFIKDSIKNNNENSYFLMLANRYLNKGDYLNSLGILEKYENLLKREDYKNLAVVNNLKTDNYYLLGQYKKALTYNKKAISLFNKDKDTTNLFNCLFFQTELNYYQLNNKNKSYKLLDSISKLENWNNFYLKYKYYNIYGLFNFDDKNYNKAYKNYLKSLFYIKKSPYKSDLTDLADTYANISEVLILQKKGKLSKLYLDSVDQYKNYLTVSQTKFHLQNKLRYVNLFDRNYDNTNIVLDTIFSFLNNTYKKIISKELGVLKESFSTEKKLILKNKNAKIKNLKLKRKQIYLYAILGFVLLSFLIIYLLYKQYRLKTVKNNLFMQQRLFRTQMNPHFISNILYSIQRLIKTDSKLANTYLVKFSRLLRLILENSLENHVTVASELEVLTKYLDLQQLQFDKKFEYEIKINNIDKSIVYIPPMLIQPFVENAILHGFKNINYVGKINLKLNLKSNFVFCEIIDNGKSNNKETINKSVSTKLIKDLIYKLSKEEIKIISNNKGTTVKFKIPFVKKL